MVVLTMKAVYVAKTLMKKQEYSSMKNIGRVNTRKRPTGLPAWWIWGSRKGEERTRWGLLIGRWETSTISTPVPRKEWRYARKCLLPLLGIVQIKLCESLWGNPSVKSSHRRIKEVIILHTTSWGTTKLSWFVSTFSPTTQALHIRRKHAPNRLYISPIHSTASMLKDFNETYNTDISKSRYYKEIKDMNISFVKLGEEECEDCDLHDKHLTDDHGILRCKRAK